MRTIVRATLLVTVLIVSTGTVFALDKQDPQKRVPQGKTDVLIEAAFTVNRARTAVLIMDYENDIVGSLPEDVRMPLLERTSTVIKEAHQANIPVILKNSNSNDFRKKLTLHVATNSSLPFGPDYVQKTLTIIQFQCCDKGEEYRLYHASQKFPLFGEPSQQLNPTLLLVQ